jgi:hypothetical protein
VKIEVPLVVNQHLGIPERKISMKTETISYINKRNILLKFLFLLFYPKQKQKYRESCDKPILTKRGIPRC